MRGPRTRLWALFLLVTTKIIPFLRGLFHSSRRGLAALFLGRSTSGTPSCATKKTELTTWPITLYLPSLTFMPQRRREIRTARPRPPAEGPGLTLLGRRRYGHSGQALELRDAWRGTAAGAPRAGRQPRTGARSADRRKKMPPGDTPASASEPRARGPGHQGRSYLHR